MGAKGYVREREAKEKETWRKLRSRARAGTGQRNKQNNEPLGEGRRQRTVKQGDFANAVTSELNVAEHDAFFQKVEEGMLLAKAL